MDQDDENARDEQQSRPLSGLDLPHMPHSEREAKVLAAVIDVLGWVMNNVVAPVVSTVRRIRRLGRR
jgi:hypothetical protein